MSSVAIYMEGGGKGRDTKTALRQGMDVFLNPIKNVARNKSCRWKLVPCGGRDAAFRAFEDAIRNGNVGITILLVDAEGPVSVSAREHLKSRDRWDTSFTADDSIHLMIQTMETWIVADPEAMADYYGNHFRKNVLPPRDDLESVSKAEIAQVLERSTRETQKGVYHKIRHASELLKRIDPSKVRQRCQSCEKLFNTVIKAVEAL